MSDNLYDISDATGTANDVLVGKIAYTSTGEVDGALKIYDGQIENLE